MSSDYMRALVDRIEESEKKHLDEGILDSIEDYITKKGLEWKSKYSKRALGALDTRNLAGILYDVFEYQLGRQGRPSVLENAIKFTKDVIPQITDEDIEQILERAGINPPSQTNEGRLAFLSKLNEYTELSDRQIKKFFRALTEDFFQIVSDPEDLVNVWENLWVQADTETKQKIEQRLKLFGKKAVKAAQNEQEPPVDAASTEQPKTSDKPETAEKQAKSAKSTEQKKKSAEKEKQKPGIKYFANSFNVPQEAVRGLLIVGNLGYIRTEDKKLKFDNSQFIKDVAGMKGNKLQGTKLSNDHLRSIQAFLEATANNKEKALNISKSIKYWYPEKFE